MLARALLQISSITSPLDITGCVGWWDAADSTTITEVSGAISAWNDKSASGFNLAQTDTNEKPTYTASGLNGRNVVTYDGGDNLILGSTSALQNVGGWTMFAVAKTTVTTAQQNFFFVGANNAVGSSRALMYFDSANKIAVGGRRLDADTFAGAVAASAHGTGYGLFSAIGAYADTDLYIYTGGSQVASNTSWLTTGNTSNTNGYLQLGATGGGTPNTALTGAIAEAILYNVALSTTNRQLVENYLKIKWGL